MEQHLLETFENNNDEKIGEELVDAPVKQISNEDKETIRNDDEYFKISEDAVDNVEEGNNSELKVYAICCAIVVLYKLYHLNM